MTVPTSTHRSPYRPPLLPPRAPRADCFCSSPSPPTLSAEHTKANDGLLRCNLVRSCICMCSLHGSGRSVLGLRPAQHVRAVPPFCSDAHSIPTPTHIDSFPRTQHTNGYLSSTQSQAKPPGTAPLRSAHRRHTQPPLRVGPGERTSNRPSTSQHPNQTPKTQKPNRQNVPARRTCRRGARRWWGSS